MAADYDLIILGSSTAAEQLALEASARKARVAWITFPAIVSDWHIQQLLHPQLDWQWQLVSRGIDVLETGAQLVAPHTLQVGRRTLTGKHFVVCNPSQLNLRQWVQGWTWQDFYHGHPPLAELAVVGASALSVAVAQWLNRRGVAVSLLLPTTSLFPSVDRETTGFLQAQLEGQGIKVFTGHKVTATRKSGDGQALEVWAGDRHFTVSHLLLPQFNSVVSQLRLEFISSKRLHFLTSRNDIASILKRTLFWFEEVRDALSLIYYPTDPVIAQVSHAGKPQGKQLVLRSIGSAHFAKVVTSPKGEILSASMVGESAVFWIEAIAQVMRAGKCIGSLSTHNPISAELVAQFSEQQRHPLRELWLNICRDFHL